MADLIIWAVLIFSGLWLGYRIGYDCGFSDGMKKEEKEFWGDENG